MHLKETRSGGEGLERSCSRTGADWIASTGPVAGVELFRARLVGEAYEKHRHDTYAVCVTDCGVQVFDYRGAVHVSLPGQVTVLYPDEVHDGRAGTKDGFGYRIVYVEPSRLSEALGALCGRPYPLPFVSEPVSANPKLARAVQEAFQSPLDSLAADGIVSALAEGLMAGTRSHRRAAAAPRQIDVPAMERARQFLDAERTHVVHSRQLESITGLTRYDLARQFRVMFGTSPYRYLLMRRLEFARERMLCARPLADVACETGFADQAHFTRTFKGAFGLTPARYRALLARRMPPDPCGSSAAAAGFVRDWSEVQDAPLTGGKRWAD